MTNVKIIILTSIAMAVLFITGSSVYASLSMVPQVPQFPKPVPAEISSAPAPNPVEEIAPVEAKSFETIKVTESVRILPPTLIRALTLQEQIDLLEKRVSNLEKGR